MGPHGQRLSEEGEDVWESWKEKYGWWRHTIRLERKREWVTKPSDSPAREPRLDLARHRHTSVPLLSSPLVATVDLWWNEWSGPTKLGMMGSWSPKGPVCSTCWIMVHTWSLPCRNRPRMRHPENRPDWLMLVTQVFCTDALHTCFPRVSVQFHKFYCFIGFLLTNTSLDMLAWVSWAMVS